MDIAIFIKLVHCFRHTVNQPNKYLGRKRADTYYTARNHNLLPYSRVSQNASSVITHQGIRFPFAVFTSPKPEEIALCFVFCK